MAASDFLLNYVYYAGGAMLQTPKASQRYSEKKISRIWSPPCSFSSYYCY